MPGDECQGAKFKHSKYTCRKTNLVPDEERDVCLLHAMYTSFIKAFHPLLWRGLLRHVTRLQLTSRTGIVTLALNQRRIFIPFPLFLQSQSLDVSLKEVFMWLFQCFSVFIHQLYLKSTFWKLGKKSTLSRVLFKKLKYYLESLFLLLHCIMLSICSYCKRKRYFGLCIEKNLPDALCNVSSLLVYTEFYLL